MSGSDRCDDGACPAGCAPPDDREEALELLKAAGFTEAQADVLATMYEVLQREKSPQTTFDPFGPPLRQPVSPMPTHGVWQHPSFADLLPVIFKALPDLLELLVARLRPRPEPPRPWWQRALRKLAGLDT